MTGIGSPGPRPDAADKVTGAFRYASDLTAEGMLWGATLRSPHPRARILGIDTTAAAALPGVSAVLTAADLPASRHYGLEVADTPVLALGEVRHHGEPVAVVAAEDPPTARRALALIDVRYDVLEPVLTEAQALAPGAPPVNPHGPGNVVARQRVRTGTPAPADVVVHGRYEVGMQDQTPLGPEAGLAIPGPDGGIHLIVATQWLHVDRAQLAPVLGLPKERIRLTLGGVGGAFGAREDLSVQAHACLLALRTGRPVKIVYTREESFLGHVHRHPAVLDYTHGATRDGRLVFVRARVVLDGGAYASSTAAVVGNIATLGVGPYRVPHVDLEAVGLYTNNPPCGAMRGFGAVQACFGYEAQMDRLAAELGMDPVELRRRNALSEGGRMPHGQVLDSPTPVAELLRRVAESPPPPRATCAGAVTDAPGAPAATAPFRRGTGAGESDGGRKGTGGGACAENGGGGACGENGSGDSGGGRNGACGDACGEYGVAGSDRGRNGTGGGAGAEDGPGEGAAGGTYRPGGRGGGDGPAGGWADGGATVRRGVGYAVGVKNVAFSQGFDDYSTARVRLGIEDGAPVVTVHTAAAEVGQGGVTVWAAIARTELGVARVVLAPADTHVGSAGSTSASRQTYVTGGAVRAACAGVRARVLALGGWKPGEADLRDGAVTGRDGRPLVTLGALLGGRVVEHTARYRHRPTGALDPRTGQGPACVQFSFCAHRAVVDVDMELGLVTVVELAAAQDVGRAMNPQGLLGQIHGGSTQGLGLAVMEELVVTGGVVRNGSFSGYLIPTVLDVPPMPVEILELPDPHAPYGLRGAGEASAVSSGAAVVAAIRAATGLDLPRVPVRPEHVALAFP